MKLSYLLLLSSLFLVSCQSLEEPQIKSVSGVKIKEMSKEKIDLDASLVIHNPNNVALDLSSADLQVLVDDIVLAEIHQTLDAKMPAKEDFELPVNIALDLKKLYEDNPIAAIGKGLQIMSDRKIEIVLRGDIKAGKGIAKLTVPVEQKEWVSF